LVDAKKPAAPVTIPAVAVSGDFVRGKPAPSAAPAAAEAAPKRHLDNDVLFGMRKKEGKPVLSSPSTTHLHHPCGQ
jgi:hypothetical protein